MNIFNKLFGKKEKPIKEIQKIGVVCDYCGEEIFEYESRTKKAGKKFHRRCFKKMRKEAKRIAFG